MSFHRKEVHIYPTLIELTPELSDSGIPETTPESMLSLEG